MIWKISSLIANFLFIGSGTDKKAAKRKGLRGCWLCFSDGARPRSSRITCLHFCSGKFVGANCGLVQTFTWNDGHVFFFFCKWWTRFFAWSTARTGINHCNVLCNRSGSQCCHQRPSFFTNQKNMKDVTARQAEAVASDDTWWGRAVFKSDILAGGSSHAALRVKPNFL